MSLSIFLRSKDSGEDNSDEMDKKYPIFISYAHENYDKVNHIKKALKDHRLFEALVVEDKNKPNQALGKLIKEGIDASICVIPILSPQSYRKQWINQEIGYAEGRKKIIPIIEARVLGKLHGFVNDQNQCPYSYNARDRQHRREENKSFMRKFRQLICDFEKEYEDENYVSGYNPSGKVTMKRTIFPHQPLGTSSKTGEACPEGGIWVTDFEPIQVRSIPKGTKMPSIQGHSVKWKLSEYLDNLNNSPNG